MKPQPNKVQAILTLTLPKGVKDLRRFLGMVQYYQDLWVSCSNMLAPLSSLIGECGHTKVTRANKTKKKPWHWYKVHQKDVMATITKDVVLVNPDYSKDFEIYPVAS